MLNDDALHAAMRELADRVVPDPTTLTSVRRAGHRLHRRHQAYAATGVVAVLAGTPLTVHAVAGFGTGGPVQVVGPAGGGHHRGQACRTPTASPSPGASTATPGPCACGCAGTATPVPSRSPLPGDAAVPPGSVVTPTHVSTGSPSRTEFSTTPTPSPSPPRS